MKGHLCYSKKTTKTVTGFRILGFDRDFNRTDFFYCVLYRVHFVVISRVIFVISVTFKLIVGFVG